jgi:hypothetical protein
MRIPYDLVTALLDRLATTLPEQDVSTELGRFTIDVRPAFAGTNPVSGRRLRAPTQVEVVLVPSEALQRDALGPLLGKGVAALIDPVGPPAGRPIVAHPAAPIYDAVVEGVQALKAPFPLGTGRSGYRVRGLGTFVVSVSKRHPDDEHFDAQLLLRVDPILAQRVAQSLAP